MRHSLALVASLAIAMPLGAQGPAAPTYACPEREYRKKSYRLTAEAEDFEGNRRVGTRQADLQGTRFLGLREGVQLEQLTPRTGRPTLRLFYGYTAKDWFFIESGESLRFLIDGEMVRLSTTGASREEPELITGKMVRERAMYPVTAATLRKLAAARPEDVTIYVYGGKGRREYAMNATVSCMIARFVTEVVDRPRAPATAAAAPKP